jgi:uncharacterized alpha-E superfamily protein
VGYNLAALRRSADNVRERLSQEQRHLIERLDDGFRAAHRSLSANAEYAPQEALEALEDASELLSAVTGAQIDRMVRDDGWRMLSIGRHIERISMLAEALALGLQTGSLEEDSGFEALLALFDSSITFHAQYQQRRDLVALLDLLVTHRDNPRSLAWVLSTLRARVSKLPMTEGGAAIMLAEQLPDPNSWDLIDLAGLNGRSALPDQPAALPHTELHALLTHCQRAVTELSDQLGARYFSHADRTTRSLMA